MWVLQDSTEGEKRNRAQQLSADPPTGSNRHIRERTRSTYSRRTRTIRGFIVTQSKMRFLFILLCYHLKIVLSKQAADERLVQMMYCVLSACMKKLHNDIILSKWPLPPQWPYPAGCTHSGSISNWCIWISASSCAHIVKACVIPRF